MRGRLTLAFRALLLGVLAAGAACAGDREAPALATTEDPIVRDLEQIQVRDTLVVLTTYNSTSYFLYRGEALGFEYELLRAFARDRELVLRTVVVRERERLLDMLNRGDGDVVAARLIPTSEMREQVAFTRSLYRTQPVLVQRGAPLADADVPEAVDTLLRRGSSAPAAEGATLRARLVSNPAQLAGRDVHVAERSPYAAHLVELSDTITGDIQVVEVDRVSAEALHRLVAKGDIEFAVSQENLARLSQSYFSNLAIQPAVGDAHRIAWAVRRNAPALRAALDEWIGAQEEAGRLQELYDRYFVDRRGYRERAESEFLTSETGRLSDYDDLLRENAATLGWDWRLLASQAYQESRFDPEARSWAGAVGLLQLMPATARQNGVIDPRDPAQNVRGAVRFLSWLEEFWGSRIPDPEERRRFVLASYNTGTGHVEDAQRLATKHGGNPQVWEDVAAWLLQKSKREVYTDPVVKYGFSRGLEPVTYVAVVLERWEHYREFVVR
ncbi:MAG: transporter substrate-binding domain-containing protein [Gemmatimonadota bacterium]|jgi:membrane-bound lytic murein transglycosylase F|nr:transporter substrate-binding domain-containing protein [Gemmatimonadota bacterium]